MINKFILYSLIFFIPNISCIDNNFNLADLENKKQEYEELLEKRSKADEDYFHALAQTKQELIGWIDHGLASCALIVFAVLVINHAFKISLIEPKLGPLPLIGGLLLGGSGGHHGTIAYLEFQKWYKEANHIEPLKIREKIRKIDSEIKATNTLPPMSASGEFDANEPFNTSTLHSIVYSNQPLYPPNVVNQTTQRPHVSVQNKLSKDIWIPNSSTIINSDLLTPSERYGITIFAIIPIYPQESTASSSNLAHYFPRRAIINSDHSALYQFQSAPSSSYVTIIPVLRRWPHATNQEIIYTLLLQHDSVHRIHTIIYMLPGRVDQSQQLLLEPGLEKPTRDSLGSNVTLLQEPSLVFPDWNENLISLPLVTILSKIMQGVALIAPSLQEDTIRLACLVTLQQQSTLIEDQSYTILAFADRPFNPDATQRIGQDFNACMRNSQFNLLDKPQDQVIETINITNTAIDRITTLKNIVIAPVLMLAALPHQQTNTITEVAPSTSQPTLLREQYNSASPYHNGLVFGTANIHKAEISMNATNQSAVQENIGWDAHKIFTTPHEPAPTQQYISALPVLMLAGWAYNNHTDEESIPALDHQKALLPENFYYHYLLQPFLSQHQINRSTPEQDGNQLSTALALIESHPTYSGIPLVVSGEESCTQEEAPESGPLMLNTPPNNIPQRPAEESLNSSLDAQHIMPLFPKESSLIENALEIIMPPPPPVLIAQIGDISTSTKNLGSNISEQAHNKPQTSDASKNFLRVDISSQLPKPAIVEQKQEEKPSITIKPDVQEQRQHNRTETLKEPELPLTLQKTESPKEPVQSVPPPLTQSVKNEAQPKEQPGGQARASKPFLTNHEKTEAVSQDPQTQKETADLKPILNKTSKAPAQAEPVKRVVEPKQTTTRLEAPELAPDLKPATEPKANPSIEQIQSQKEHTPEPATDQAETTPQQPTITATASKPALTNPQETQAAPQEPRAEKQPEVSKSALADQPQKESSTPQQEVPKISTKIPIKITNKNARPDAPKAQSRQQAPKTPPSGKTTEPKPPLKTSKKPTGPQKAESAISRAIKNKYFGGNDQ